MAISAISGFSATSSSLLAFGSLLTSFQFHTAIVQQSQQSRVLSNVQLSLGVWLSSHILDFSLIQTLFHVGDVQETLRLGAFGLETCCDTCGIQTCFRVAETD